MRLITLTILFDLDGTLVDTAPDLAYALNALLLENGVEEKSYKLIKPLVAHGGKALITMGFECNESHPEFTQRHQRLLQIYTDNIDKHAKTFEGIDDLLALIKQRKLLWGIVTNKPENLSYLLLEKLGVKPDVVVCGDTLEHSKPHPAPLLYACAQLAVDPKSAMCHQRLNQLVRLFFYTIFQQQSIECISKVRGSINQCAV
jgi:phosphoglycolate phosphatase